MKWAHIIALVTVLVLVVSDSILILYILIRKKIADALCRKAEMMARRIIDEFPRLTDEQILNEFSGGANFRVLFEQYIEIRQSVTIPIELDRRIRSILIRAGAGRVYLKMLVSPLKIRRINAAVHLGYLGNEDACAIMEQRLTTEKNMVVRVYIAFALSEIGWERSIMPLVESLVNSPEWYRNKVHLFLREYGYAVMKYLPLLKGRNEEEIGLFILHFAKEHTHDELYAIVKSRLKSTVPELRMAAVKALTTSYSDDPYCITLMSKGSVEEKKAAVTAIGKSATRESAELLLGYLSDEPLAECSVMVLSKMCSESHAILEFIMRRYTDPAYRHVQRRIVEVLSNRIEYFIMKLSGVESDRARVIIKAMVENEVVNTVFSFLTYNKNREIENELLAILDECGKENRNVHFLMRQYLDERMLKKLSLEKYIPEEQPVTPGKSAVTRRRLLRNLLVILGIFPVLFIVRHQHDSVLESLHSAIKHYVIEGNYQLIFYSAAVSTVYLLLLFLSGLGAIRQYGYSRVKKKSFLFKQSMLPGISIIGPAFNEETGIIDSVNSLLNLKYPNHEVIIVNDGSRDGTLQKLIEYFRLEKVDALVHEVIVTQTILGIYRNRSFPKLTVVDKVNGGKADSLNVGINIASKEYFCGIDADSLLSEDSLLKVVSSSLDIETETVAMGGNIFPVNGCTVRHGVLESIGIPHNAIANLQFVEYIRAFMAGRLGWAYLDSMLIISGAFGLFKRSRVIECGGYLTRSGKYGLDTVGEDMELVVRLTKYMRENRFPYKIGYSHNANCWTEVPEKPGILLRQRDRWHRGLIEIFSFHRKMVANRRYGRIGFLAMPYFLAFEIFGPWIEAQGYVLLIVAILTGLLNTTVALWLFIATVMFGVFISIASLIIAEQEVNYFRMKDVIKLIGYAIVENFGFRQFMSIWRVTGYISALRGSSGWGKMVRKGFSGEKMRK